MVTNGNRFLIAHLFSPILHLWNQGSAASLRPLKCPPCCQLARKDQGQIQSSKPPQGHHRNAIWSACGVSFLIFHCRTHLLGSNNLISLPFSMNLHFIRHRKSINSLFREPFFIHTLNMPDGRRSRINRFFFQEDFRKTSSICLPQFLSRVIVYLLPLPPVELRITPVLKFRPSTLAHRIPERANFQEWVPLS